jgi:hypothetical protein
VSSGTQVADTIFKPHPDLSCLGALLAGAFLGYGFFEMTRARSK